MTRAAADLEVDVAVVGGGPAGCATALGMRRRGFSVAVLEKAVFPRDKICGDFLTPGAVRSLRALAGEALAAAGPCPLRGMRITHDRLAVESRFPEGLEGHGLTRRELDDLLARQARDEGVGWHRFTARRTLPDAGGWRVVEGSHPDGAPARIRARLVVEAAGRTGPFGRALGWRRDDTRLPRYALWSHMEGVRGLRELGEMHVFDGGYVGVGARDPASGLANVTMVLTPAAMARARRDPRAHFLSVLAAHAELGPRTQNARFVTPLKGMGPLACTAARVTGDRLALVGDAGGFVDPFTGEGVFVALESARLLAASAAAEDPGDPAALRRYGRAHAEAFAARFRLCRLLQQALGRPWLARHILRALSARRDLAERMIGTTGDLFPAAGVLRVSFVGRLLLAGMAP